jgi:hypothetical protein
MGVVLDGAFLLGMLATVATTATLLVEGWLLRLLVVVVGYAFLAGSILLFARLRHRRLIARAAAAEKLRVIALSGSHGFVHPPKLPWWRGWAMYEMEAIHAGSVARRYHVFLTGVLFCIFAVCITLTTDDDYEWSCDRSESGNTSI